MGLTFESLSSEILYKIVGYLDVKDAAKLRQLNKSIKVDVDAAPIWKREVERRWLSQFDQKSEKPRRGMSYAEYYSKRRLIDLDVIKTLHKIIDDDSSKRVFKECWRLVKKKNLITPILNKIRNSSLNRNKLSLRYFATEILRAIRRGTTYELIDRAVAAGTVPYNHLFENYEEVLYLLGHFDPGFDNLAPHREEILSIMKTFVEEVPEFSTASPGEKVRIILKTVHHYLYDREKNVAIGHYAEDNVLLRTYLKEARGHPIVIIAMVEKIAQDFGLTVQIMQHQYFQQNNFPSYMLKVRDRKEFKYVWMQVIKASMIRNTKWKDLEYNCDTGPSLYQKFKNKENIRVANITGILTPLELSNQLGIYTQNFHIFQPRESYDDIWFQYPTSKAPYPEAYHYALYDYYYLAQSSRKRFNFPMSATSLPDIMIRGYFRKGFACALVNKFPFDLPIINNKKVYRDIPLSVHEKYVIENFFTPDNVNFNVPDEIKDKVSRNLKAGDLVFTETHDPMEDVGFVIGYMYSHSENKPDLVCCYTHMVDRVLHVGKDIRDLEKIEDPNDLEIVFDNPDLGYFVKSIEDIHFVPTPFLEKPGSTTKMKGRKINDDRERMVDIHQPAFHPYGYDSGPFPEGSEYVPLLVISSSFSDYPGLTFEHVMSESFSNRELKAKVLKSLEAPRLDEVHEDSEDNHSDDDDSDDHFGDYYNEEEDEYYDFQFNGMSSLREAWEDAEGGEMNPFMAMLAAMNLGAANGMSMEDIFAQNSNNMDELLNNLHGSGANNNTTQQGNISTDESDDDLWGVD